MFYYCVYMMQLLVAYILVTTLVLHLNECIVLMACAI